MVGAESRRDLTTMQMQWGLVVKPAIMKTDWEIRPMSHAWYDPSTYLLALEIEDLDVVEAVFGESAVSRALEELGEGFRKVGAQALARHAPLPVASSQYAGRWIAPFQILDSVLHEVPQEQQQAIAATARRLSRTLFQEIFGSGSGARIAFKVAVVEAPEQAMDIDGRLDIVFSGEPVEIGCCADIGKAKIRRIVAKKDIRILLQPIVSFPEGATIGFEALTRGPGGGPLEQPAFLFGTGEHHGLGADLEIACIERALEVAESLPAPYWLSVNASPDLLGSDALKALSRRTVDTPLEGRLVVELTEHMSVDNAEALVGDVEDLKAYGIRFALDNAGCGYADLQVARVLAPDIVKLCIAIIRQLEPMADIVDDVTAAVLLLEGLGVSVLAEGVETMDQVELLRSTGVKLAQGYHYGRPAPAEQVLARLGLATK